MSRLRIAYLGSDCHLSRCVLQGLTDAGVPLRAVVISGFEPARGESTLPVRESCTGLLAESARRAGIPFRLLAPDPSRTDTRRWLQDQSPDLLLSSCFARRLSPDDRALARRDCWNIHPSLLPAYRGPAPLFWQLRAGETRTGVTVHRMVDAIDAGPVLAQRAVPFPCGTRRARIEEIVAAAATALVEELLVRSEAGPLAGANQNDAAASYQPAPGIHDREVPSSWAAERAFRFLSAVGADGPAVIRTGAGAFQVREVLEYRATRRSGDPVTVTGDRAWIRFRPGAVLIRFSHWNREEKTLT